MGTNYSESLRLGQGDLTFGAPHSHYLPWVTHGASKLHLEPNQGLQQKYPYGIPEEYPKCLGHSRPQGSEASGPAARPNTPAPARATPPTGPRLPPPSKWLRYTHRSHQLRTETHLEIKTKGFPSSPTKRGPLRSRLPARRHREPELQAPPASDWNALRRRAARAAGCLTTQCGSLPAGRPASSVNHRLRGRPSPPSRLGLPAGSQVASPYLPVRRLAPNYHRLPRDIRDTRAPRSRSPTGVQRARVHRPLQGPSGWLGGAANSGLLGSPTSPFPLLLFLS